MIITTEEELKILREGGKRLAHIRSALVEKTVSGVTTTELNAIAHELCTRDGDSPAFLNYTPFGAPRPFPASICISINDVVVHGIPTENPRTIQDGDLVSIDVGLIHKGIITDTAITIAVGEVSDREQEIIRTAEVALSRAIDAVSVGTRVGDISKIIEDTASEKGFGVPEELGGHGVGKRVHEDPNIPNAYSGDKGAIFSKGEVIAIEPIITMGAPDLVFDADGYTVRTKDGAKSVHVEHTVLVTEKGAEIIT